MLKCRICGSQISDDNCYKVREMMFGLREVFNYYHCQSCGCLQIEKKPENIEQYYPEGYYTRGKEWKRISTSRSILWKIRSRLSQTFLYYFISKIRYNSILNWVHAAKLNFDSNILDVGCGNGDVLFEFSKHGFINLTGLDPYLSKELKSEGIKLLKLNLKDLINQRKYDLIIFNHSFEHIWEQDDTIEKAKNLLTKKGTLLIHIPIVNYAFEKYHENWVQIDAPRHFFLHSFNSFNLLCEKHNLKIKHYYYDSTEFQFMGSEKFKRNISSNQEESYKINFSNSILKMRDLQFYQKESYRLNRMSLGDQAVFFVKNNG